MNREYVRIIWFINKLLWCLLICDYVLYLNQIKLVRSHLSIEIKWIFSRNIDWYLTTANVTQPDVERRFISDSNPIPWKQLHCHVTSMWERILITADNIYIYIYARWWRDRTRAWQHRMYVKDSIYMLIKYQSTQLWLALSLYKDLFPYGFTKCSGTFHLNLKHFNMLQIHCVLFVVLEIIYVSGSSVLM